MTLDSQSIDKIASLLNTLADYSPHAEQAPLRQLQVITVPEDTTTGSQSGDFWRPQLTVPVLALNEDRLSIIRVPACF